MKIPYVITTILVILVLIFFRNYQTKTDANLQRLKPGDLLIVKGYLTNGKDSRAKVLAIDQRNGSKIYSLKIYPQDTPDYVTTADGLKVDTSGIGHIPLSERTFSKWQVKITGFEKVKNEELEGYKSWEKDSKAGAY